MLFRSAECATAKAAWDAFAKLFKSKSQARRMQLMSELSTLCMQPGEPRVKLTSREPSASSQSCCLSALLWQNIPDSVERRRRK